MRLRHFVPCVCLLSACAADSEPVVGEREAARSEVGGDTYGISRGDAFAREGDRSVLAQDVFDPDFYAENYEEKGGRVFRKNREGERIEVIPAYSPGLEDAPALKALMTLEKGWSGLTLPSPRAKTVADYGLKCLRN
jgi:hypothetical protein